jgi:tripartite-type tricarboxylate transporter receptor subunit TctC
MKRLFAARGAVALVATLLAGPAQAADPIKMVVPFAAGGPVDALARIVAAELAPRLQADVVVEDRGGAGGLLAVDQVMRWRPTAAPSCSRAWELSSSPTPSSHSRATTN